MLIDCIRRFGGNLTPAERQALTKDFGKYQKQNYSPFLSSVMALEGLQSQINQNLSELKTELNLPTAEKEKPELVGLYEKDQSLTDFLSTLKTNGYSGVDIFELEAEILKLFEEQKPTSTVPENQPELFQEALPQVEEKPVEETKPIAESALGERGYNGVWNVLQSKKEVPKSKTAAQQILDSISQLDKVKDDAGMLSNDVLEALKTLFIAEASKTNPETFRQIEWLSDNQRQIYRWMINGTFKKNFAETLNALQSGEVEYVDNQTSEISDISETPASATTEGFEPTVYNLANAVAGQFMLGNGFENINQARKFLGELLGRKIEPGTEDAKLADEIVELGVVFRAKSIVQNPELNAGQKYDELVKLYELQPNLSVRTSTSIEQQAYSTPAPLAFVASHLARINQFTRVYEPTAGNGILLMEANPSKAVVNELNSDRADNLRQQLFSVSEVDAAERENPANPYDAIIANPPFGTVKNDYGLAKEWIVRGPYRTNQIDHKIIFQALKGLREGGRAVFLLGGPSKIATDEQRKQGYHSQAKRAFFHFLTQNYNLVDHFTIDGNLYRKQGAAFPVDVLVVENNLRPGQKSKLGMPEANLPQVFSTWEDLKQKTGEQNDYERAVREDGERRETGELESAGKLGTGTVGSNLSSTETPTNTGDLFDVSGGQAENLNPIGGQSRTGISQSDSEIAGSKSVGSRDYSDSTEFGNDRTKSGSSGKTLGTRSDGEQANADAGRSKRRRSGSISGNESGGLDVGTPNLTDGKEEVQPKEVKEGQPIIEENNPPNVGDVVSTPLDIFNNLKVGTKVVLSKPLDYLKSDEVYEITDVGKKQIQFQSPRGSKTFVRNSLIFNAIKDGSFEVKEAKQNLKEKNQDLEDTVLKAWAEESQNLLTDLDDMFSIDESEAKPKETVTENFNQANYEKLLPRFQKIWNAIKDQVADVQEGMKRFVRFLRDSANATREQLIKLRPYIVKFIVDVQNELKSVARTKHIRPELTAEQIASSSQIQWLPQSKGDPMNTLLPANQYNAVVNALNDLEDKVGDIDHYVADKLGYNKENGEIYNYFGGEQIDALALALDNIENGSGFIIGDMGGVGKGRMVAGILKYAMINGHIPIFVTEKANLYKDIYRDLTAIGLEPHEIQPLMTNAEELIPLTDHAIDVMQEFGSHVSSRHVRRLIRDGEVLQTQESKYHNPFLEDAANNRAMPEGFNMIFTTYDGMKTIEKGQDTVRRKFLRSIINNSILVLDESHNAGGSGTQVKTVEGQAPNRAEFVRELVNQAIGVFYSSATWAKRPDVMSLYSKTDMSLAVEGDINQLGAAIESGGVPLQQVVSAMLAESGQYMRRERDFNGIRYDTTPVVIDKNQAESVGKCFLSIFQMSKYLEKQVIPEIAKDLIAEAKTVNPMLGTDVNMTSNGFANVMHNAIAQMLLALKVKPAVEEAIRDLKEGKKVVLTVANTMGQLISEYAEVNNLKPGDALELNFGQVLRTYTEKSRTVSVGKPYGEKTIVRLTDDMMTDEGLKLYNDTLKLIDSLDFSNLPGSPIDWMIAELERAGYKVGEITGRNQAMQYNDDGSAIYRRRPQSEISIKGRNETIKGFNSGTLDVLIINQAGSTGLSLHAAIEFADQKQRVMSIVQPEANIDTFMQILYRVNRTGQVNVPHYKQLTADIPAEKRPAANLAMKMAKLNANTTAAVDSAVTAKDVLDFMNKYGDAVIAQYLEDNSELHELLGAPLEKTDTGLKTDGAARKATGRLPILPLAQQEEFYEAIGEMYQATVDQLKSLGEYDLEAQTLPLDAKTITRRKIFEGPGGDRPFAQGAYGEEVEVRRLTRPRSKDEVTKFLQKALDLDEATNHNQIELTGQRVTKQMFDEINSEITPYIEKELDKLDDDYKIQATRTRLEGLQSRLARAFRVAPIGSTVEVKIGNQTYYGVVSAIRKMNRAKTPLALSDYHFTVLTTDASRQLIIPASQIYTEDFPAPGGNLTAATIGKAWNQPGFMGGHEPIWDAFDSNSRTVTERRVIVTGNLLAGYSTFQEGRIIYYTTADGEIKQGILMPKTFNLEKELKEQPVRFKNVEQIADFLSSGSRMVVSLDGEVRLTTHYGDLTIAVPASKAKGAKYFNNQKILAAADGKQFVTAGRSAVMKLQGDTEAFKNVVQELVKMGVNFETNVFKDVARQIVGKELPKVEVVQSESHELQAEIKRQEEIVREANSPFTSEEFNTRSGEKLFVAKAKGRLVGRDLSNYNRLARKYNGYYSSFNREGAIPGFHFKTEKAREDFLNEIAAEAMDKTVFSIEDNEELKRQEAVRLIKNVPLPRLAPKATAIRTGNRIKFNLAGMELMRRALEQVEINEEKKDLRSKNPYPSFMGAFPDVNKVQKAIRVLDSLTTQAEQNRMFDVATALKGFSQILKDASRRGNRGAVVFYVLDKKLPQELFHQATTVGSGWKLFNERHTREGIAKMDNSPQFKKADKTFFSKFANYSIENFMDKGMTREAAEKWRNGIIREEIAAWTVEGSWEKLGLTEEEAFGYLLDFLQSFGDKVYNDNIDIGKTPTEARAAQAEAFQNFDEVDYARETIKYLLKPGGRSGEQTSAVGQTDETSGENFAGQPDGTDGKIKIGGQEVGTGLPIGFEPRTIVRPKGDASELAGVNEFPGVLKKYNLASLPKTERAVGIAADDVVYTVFSDRAAQEEAQVFLNEHGVAGAYNLLISETALPSPDVHHAVAAFALQKAFQDEAVRIESTNPMDAEKLLELSRELGAKLALRMTRAGRFIRAAGVILKNAPGAVEVATKLYQEKHGINADLPNFIKQRIKKKVEKNESDLAQHEALTKERDALAKELEIWKQKLKDLEAGKEVTINLASPRRSKLVKDVLSRHTHEVDKAFTNLQSFSFVKPITTVNNDGNIDTTVFSIEDVPTEKLPPETFADFVTVAAQTLTKGLSQPEIMRPSQFDEEMISLFGTSIAPHLEMIHRDGLRLRNKWLADMVKEKKVKAIIAELGDDVTEFEIEAILQEDADKLLKRQAIMRLHNYRAEKGQKVEQLSAIEHIIDTIAPDENSAFAASALIHHKPSAHELYRLLELENITGMAAREAIRKGVEVLEKAKLQHAKEETEKKEELRQRIENGEQDFDELKTLVAKSKTRARESQVEIQKELQRISTGELKFAANLTYEILNTSRAIMASADVSFLLRQGGWFMFARPTQQGMAFRAMFQAFSEKVSKVGFDRAMDEMENNPYFQLAIKSGVDFAHLGKHGEHSITKGEEVFRQNIFGILSNITEESDLHKFNVARLPNFLIKKSDEIYTAFLDAQRLATFAQTAEYFENVLDMSYETDPKEFRALAEYINDATGRSNIGKSKIGEVLLNLPLFAPRFTISRFKLLWKSTLGMAFLPPKTRKVVFKDAVKFYGIVGGLTSLAWMAGLSAGLDWEDDDFLKIKIGTNHIDLFAGLQQTARPIARLLALAIRGVFGYPRENIKLQREKTNDAGQVIGTETYASELWSEIADAKYGAVIPFLRRKLSPVASLPIDYFMGEDSVGQPFTWSKALTQRLTPLGLSEVVRQTAGTISGEKSGWNIPLSVAALSGVGYSEYPDKVELTKTRAEKLAQKINGMRFDKGVDDVAADTLKRKLTDLKTRARQGVDVTPELDVMVNAGEISSDDKRRVLKQLNDSYFNSQIRSMPEDGLKQIRAVANPTEAQIIDDLLAKRQANKQKTLERQAAKERLGLPTKPNARTSASEVVEKSVGEKLKKADVEDALILYEINRDKMTADQAYEFRKTLKGKVLNSYQRGSLTRERYGAAKKILGDDLKFIYKESKIKTTKPRSSALNSLY